MRLELDANEVPPHLAAFFEPVNETISIPPKCLMQMPARLALRLIDDGWILRSDIIWHKPNPMPESVTDRPTRSHEYVFLLAKSGRYFYDAEAIREGATADYHRPGTDIERATGKHPPETTNGRYATTLKSMVHTSRNARSVWEITPEAFPESHFATYPTELVRRCVAVGTSERGVCPACGAPWVRVTDKGFTPTQRFNSGRRYDPDGVFASHRWKTSGRSTASTLGWRPSCRCPEDEPVPALVLDPFVGSGTTVLVANRMGRRGIGLELSPAYAQMARDRIISDAPLLEQQATEPPAAAQLGLAWEEEST